MNQKLGRRAIEKFGDDGFTFLLKRFAKMGVEKAERTGARLGVLHYMLDSKHRNRTHSNLHLIYPEWSERKVKQTSIAVFKHFGLIAGDFMRSPKRSNQEVIDSVVEVEGIEHLHQSQQSDRGVVLVCAHFGNWERFLQWLTANGQKISVIAREADQQGVTSQVVGIRRSVGATVLIQGDSARPSLSALRKKEMIGLLADQNSKDSMVPFMGYPAGTVMGPAVFHTRAQANILPAHCIRVGCGKYKVIFQPMIDPEFLVEDRVEIMTSLNLSLESVIREYPEQWLWMHDRWKYARNAGLLPTR